MAEIAGRGPSGTPPPPPADLASWALPITELPAGERFYRIHRLEHDSIFFSPLPGAPPTGRFDSPSGRFRVLYAALSFAGALLETLLRNPAKRLVALQLLEERAITALVAQRMIRMVDLRGPGLQLLGLDASVYARPYENCGEWADSLFLHAEAPDGLIYPSRFDPRESCVALFRRADLVLQAAEPGTPLSTRFANASDVLREYGKGFESS